MLLWMCDQCGKKSRASKPKGWVHVDTNQRQLDLCSWTCVLTLATEREKDE